MSSLFSSLPFLVGVAYLLISPIALWGAARFQKWFRIDRVLQNSKGKISPDTLPKPAWGVWKQRIRFTVSDKRSIAIGKKTFNIQRRIFLLTIYVFGLVISVVGAFLSNWVIVVVGFFTFFVAAIFGIQSSKSLMSERERIMGRMLEVGKSKLGLPSTAAINVDVKVLDWQDFVNPQKVQYTVPTNFSATGADGFLQQFNQVFGNTQEWVASEADGGWDYDKGIVTLGAVPPLPTRANWSEHYVLSEGVADSFFPLGLSVIGGVEIPNPETGEVEHVLGYDVGGKQMAEGQKAGLVVDGSLGAASPMQLFAGATGSGKALSSDTPVAVYRLVE